MALVLVTALCVGAVSILVTRHTLDGTGGTQHASASPADTSPAPWQASGTLLAVPGTTGPTGLTLAWTAPQVSWPIAGYRLQRDGHDIGESGQDHTAAQSALAAFRADPDNSAAYTTATRYVTVTGLAPLTTHSFSVEALDEHGQSHPFGKELTITTAAASSITDVLSMGATGDGTHDDTAAIQRAIDASPAGGTVLLPAGKTFLSGPLQLKSQLTLDVEGTLLGSTVATDYRSPDSAQPKPLISAGSDAEEVRDIRIIGGGTINGQGWKTVAQQQFAKGNDSTVVSTGLLAAAQDAYARSALNASASKAYQWRSSLISVRHTTGLYVGGGLSLVNPSMHVLTVNDSHTVTLDGLTVDSYDTNNGDGIDFANSQGLDVLDSIFDTGDDSVDLNAGYGTEGEKEQPVSDVWVFDNYFRHGHAALALGSGTAAGISQVLAEDNVVNGSASGLRVKSSAGNGGGVHDIIFRNSALSDITEEQGEPFVVTGRYPQSQAASTANATDGPLFHDISVSGCTIDTTSGPGIAITGLASAPPTRINFSSLRFTHAKPAQISGLQNSSFTDVTSDLGAGFFAQLTDDSGLVFTRTPR
ncbi:exo-poly-alpha-galacturonosidase [Propionibacterium cyclohexanicum]|uniref:Exo-poly-alpha-galacturonosidase n=1 Tax=Propionibacterium cyclohexanicum TaxID=64702 RepID=A0A1H9SNL2_9ACTN|nr:glycosyl hydrolase family 28 protein [Propionibacterium cyclohexanicum]SER86335.1 exo-poly-alpha-galacturonosidase [Propionibacterium cyclohexanicum]